MLDWIEVDVIQVQSEVPRVGDAVLPEASLPHTPQPVSPLPPQYLRFPPGTGKVRARESLFQDAHPRGVVKVALREAP